MKIRLLMKDRDYMKALIRAMGRADSGLYVECGRNWDCGEEIMAVTDISPERITTKLSEAKLKGTVFAVRYPVERICSTGHEGCPEGPFYVYKYSPVSEMLADLNFAYSIWTGQEQGMVKTYRTFALFSDGCSDSGTETTEMFARQIVYRTGEPVLIIPLGFVPAKMNRDSGNRFMRLMYSISAGRTIPAEALFIRDNYDVCHIDVPPGINPLLKLNSRELLEISRILGERYFKNIVFDIGSVYTDTSIAVISASDYPVWCFGDTEQAVLKAVSGERLDDVRKLDCGGGIERMKLLADGIINEIMGKNDV